MSNVASTLLLQRQTKFRQQNKLNLFNLFQLCRKYEISPKKTRSTLLQKKATLLPKTATSEQHLTLSKGRYFTINSFDIVAIFGKKVERCFDKVERCFDIVAGVDRASHT